MDQVVIIRLFHTAVDVVGEAAHIQTFDETGDLYRKNGNKISRCQFQHI